jgi:hypothetical protein
VKSFRRASQWAKSLIHLLAHARLENRQHPALPLKNRGGEKNRVGDAGRCYALVAVEVHELAFFSMRKQVE